MSNHAMTWAQRQHVGNTGAKFVLFVMADYADEDGICWPSHEVLAETTEQSIRSIVRHMEILAAGGWIARDGRHDEGEANSGRRNGRQVYRLLAPPEILNPKGARREKRHDTVSCRSAPAPAPNDTSNCRVDPAGIRPHVASGTDASDAVPGGENDVTNWRVDPENDTPTTTERRDNDDRTTRQPRHRSIEYPSGSISDPSAAAAVPVAAPEAAALPEAVRVIQEFDDSLASVWGEERRRPWPGPNDRVAAARWLAAGATVEICRSVFDALHRRRHAQGQQPPRALSYHDDAIADAIRLGNAPLPHASTGPTPTEQANIEERIKRDVQETLAQMGRT